MPSLKDAADAARDAIRYRREVGGDVAIANSHEAFDALLQAVEEDLAVHELRERCFVRLGGAAFTWLTVRPCCDGTWKSVGDKGKHAFPNAVEALVWVKAREGK